MQVNNLKDAQSRETISELMVMTIPNRMDWVKSIKPSTKQVLKEFPHLKDFDIVSNIVYECVVIYICICNNYFYSWKPS